MTQSEARVTVSGVRDPKPTNRDVVQERGEKVSELIEDYRQALFRIPEFGMALSVGYLNVFEPPMDFEGEHGVFFKKNGSYYTISFRGPDQSNGEKINDSRRFTLERVKRKKGKIREHEKVVLDFKADDNTFTGATVTYVDFGYKGRGSIPSHHNNLRALDRSREVLEDLKKKQKNK